MQKLFIFLFTVSICFCVASLSDDPNKTSTKLASSQIYSSNETIVSVAANLIYDCAVSNMNAVNLKSIQQLILYENNITKEYWYLSLAEKGIVFGTYIAAAATLQSVKKESILCYSKKRWKEFEIRDPTYETRNIDKQSTPIFGKIQDLFSNSILSIVFFILFLMVRVFYGFKSTKDYNPILDNLTYFTSNIISVFTFQSVYKFFGCSSSICKFFAIFIGLPIAYFIKRLARIDIFSEFFNANHFHNNLMWFVIVLILCQAGILNISNSSLGILLFTIMIISPIHSNFESFVDDMKDSTNNSYFDSITLFIKYLNPKFQQLIGYYFGRWSYFLSSSSDPISHAFFGSLSDPIFALLFQGSDWMNKVYNASEESDNPTRNELLDQWLSIENDVPSWMNNVEISVNVPIGYRHFIENLNGMTSLFPWILLGVLTTGSAIWGAFMYDESYIDEKSSIMICILALISYISMYPLAIMLSQYAPSKYHIKNLVGTPIAVFLYVTSLILSFLLTKLFEIIMGKLKHFSQLECRFLYWTIFHVAKRGIYTILMSPHDFQTQFIHGFGLDLRYTLTFEAIRAVPAIMRFYSGIPNLYDDDYLLAPLYSISLSMFNSKDYGILNQYVHELD